MKSIVIIPARMSASRFPNKPLEKILGIPMLGHCYHRSVLAVGSDSVYVATCDTEIADYIKSISGNVVMTSRLHERATTRTSEAVEIIEKEIGENIDNIIMVQGDEPLISPARLLEMIKYFDGGDVQIVNLMTRLNTLEQFKDQNNVKVVVNKKNEALYFSREPIPSPWKGVDGLRMFMQTGIIAFKKDALIEFNQLNEGELEKIESIDMNRVLENCGKIKMVQVDEPMIGVDTVDELRVVEGLMENDLIFRKYANHERA